MTDTTASQNIDPSSWITLYIRILTFMTSEDEYIQLTSPLLETESMQFNLAFVFVIL